MQYHFLYFVCVKKGWADTISTNLSTLSSRKTLMVFKKF